MPDSVLKDVYGPDWPLGLIIVTASGTPVSIMSLVGAGIDPEYNVAFNQIMFQGFRKGTGPSGLQDNVGNVYVVRQPDSTGTGDHDDYGAIVLCVKPGQTVFIAAAAPNLNVYNPNRYRIDADNNNDACLVTGFVG